MKKNFENEKVKILEKVLEKLEKEKISLPELKKEEKEIKREILSKIEEKEKEKEEKKEIKKKEEKIKQSFFEDEEIIQEIRDLLLIAKKKGILASIQAARERKNPLLLDLYHDFLAQRGFFKKFFFQ